MAQFHSHLSDESDQGDRTIGTNLRMLLNFILTKQMIYPFLTSTWDHTNGCTKQYHCASAIYILSCHDLEISITIDRSEVSPGHGKDVVDGRGDRYKWMLKLSVAKLLNSKLIRDEPIFFKFMQVHENE